MIVVDIETTSLDKNKCGLLSIGAVDYDSDKEFYVECYPTNDPDIDPVSLKHNGTKLEDIYNKAKSDKEAIIDFFIWTLDINEGNLLAGHNIGNFDAMILHRLWDGTFHADWPWGHRFVDLHTIAYDRFMISMGMDAILEKLGSAPEPKPHTAINGARLEKWAFKQLFNMNSIYHL